MRTDELDYDLPPERIAAVPLAGREDARMLVLGRRDGRTSHHTVADLPDLLRPGDVLVVNDTRVLPARLAARRASGGAVELLFLEPDARGGGRWEAIVRSGGALRPGEAIEVGGGDGVLLVEELGEGRWVVAPLDTRIEDVMRARGRMPVPPYIPRDVVDARDVIDRERCQTVYARREGSVAPPSAGLHLTEGILAAAKARGVEVVPVTLHAGLGTFQPVRTTTFEEHRMHEEPWWVPEVSAEAVRRAKREGRRVVAVGTTSVRALEGAAEASPDGLPRAGEGRTSLMIRPGHAWRVVDAILTNFHLPRSSLLCLVATFAAREPVLAAYREALALGYRFDTYGDAMFVT